MKLCRDVCRECVNAYAKTHYEGGGPNGLKLTWTSNDEHKWTTAEVLECPYYHAWGVISIHKMPKECAHKLEQAVAATLESGNGK